MKKALRIGLIFLAIFVLAVVIFVLTLSRTSEEDVSYTLLSDATLPVLQLSYGDTKINTLYGYVDAADGGAFSESITPLSDDRKLNVYIDTCGNTVTGISYEIRSVSKEELVERESLDRWEIVSGKITATLPIKDLITANVPYLLSIEIATEHQAKITYYTQVIKTEGYHVADMIAYASDFHSSSFNMDSASKYAVNWEPDGSMDSDNLAYVNIHSNFNLLTYKNLSPTQAGEPDITLLSLDANFATFRIRYMLYGTNEEGLISDYYCEETFCVQYSQVRFYLMNYERHITELFSTSTATVNEKGVHLGITTADAVSILKSSDEAWTSFALAGELWSYNTEETEVNQIFSFTSGQDEARSTCHNYGIKLLKVAENGNVIFLVYGYMPRGEHEGRCGLSLFSYDYSSKSLNELLYVNASKSYEQIREDIDKLCVIWGERVYFLFDGTIFAMNDDGSEVVRLLENADEKQLIVSDAQSIIAYAEQGSVEKATLGQELFLDTGGGRSFSAGSGEYFKLYGFIDDDLVMGTGREGDIDTSTLVTIYPKYALSIVDREGGLSGSYEKAGILITNVSVGDGQISIERINSAAGGYNRIDDDVLMQNNLALKNENELLSRESGDIRGRMYLLPLVNKEKDFHYHKATPTQISYYTGQVLAASSSEQVSYYAYGKGTYAGSFKTAGEAISAVMEDMGFVVSSAGKHIWNRTSKITDKKTLSLPLEVITDEDGYGLSAYVKLMAAMSGGQITDASGSALEVLNNASGGRGVDISGVEIKQLLQIIRGGSPILALDNANNPYLIVGYDAYNIIVYDIARGENYKIGQEDATQLFAAGGNRMITFVQ